VAASVSILALLGGAGLAIWHAKAAALERDRALAFAARNEAVTEFLGTIIKEAAESSTPITVSEMLARSEKLALQDNGDIPENRAAILELIGDQYFAFGDTQRSVRITERALALIAQSSDHTLRSRLRCNYAHLQSELGQTTEAIAAIQNELRGLDSDPQTATICLLNLLDQPHSGRGFALRQGGLGTLRTNSSRTDMARNLAAGGRGLQLSLEWRQLESQ
jgi:serine/threonine-protein kinase